MLSLAELGMTGITIDYDSDSTRNREAAHPRSMQPIGGPKAAAAAACRSVRVTPGCTAADDVLAPSARTLCTELGWQNCQPAAQWAQHTMRTPFRLRHLSVSMRSPAGELLRYVSEPSYTPSGQPWPAASALHLTGLSARAALSVTRDMDPFYLERGARRIMRCAIRSMDKNWSNTTPKKNPPTISFLFWKSAHTVEVEYELTNTRFARTGFLIEAVPLRGHPASMPRQEPNPSPTELEPAEP